MSFDRFNLDPKCIRVLNGRKITVPTPVQEQAIPVGLEGRDLIAVAQTGTGKTLAFSLPALTRLAAERPSRNRMLVLTPTRELANQVQRDIDPLAQALGLRSTCIYGGVGMEPQVRALRNGCDIVVATPGRLLDHIGRGTVKFDQLQILVLDEADRMLDMGFMPDIRRILSGLPAERQTMLFSATFPDEIARLTTDFQRDAHRIDIGYTSAPPDAVQQQLYTVDPSAKTDLLAELLSAPEVFSAIVFIATKHRTDRIARHLNAKGISAEAIHGGRSQGQRDRALRGFRQNRFQVLVATDVAARGIDVQGVSHVFNLDIPRCYDDYVHRIGRTGRANATGHAVTFVCADEVKELRDIERGLNKNIDRVEWDGSIAVRSLFGEQQDRQQRPGGQRPQQPRRNGFGNRNRNFARPRREQRDFEAGEQPQQARENSPQREGHRDFRKQDRPQGEQRANHDAHKPHHRANDEQRGNRDGINKHPRANDDQRGGHRHHDKHARTEQPAREHGHAQRNPRAEGSHAPHGGQHRQQPGGPRRPGRANFGRPRGAATR